MFETLKKKALKTTLAGSIVMILIGIGLLVFMGQNAFYGLVGYATFENLEPNQIIWGQMVDVELTLNFDYYIEEYEKNTNTGRTTTTDYYYVIMTGDDYSEDVRLMTIKVPATYRSAMEKMCENTYAGYYSDPLYFYGRIRRLNNEEYNYFKEFMGYFLFGEENYTDYSAEDQELFDETTLRYYIDVVDNKLATDVIAYVVSAGGLALLIWGIIRIVKAANGSTLKSLRNTIAAEGCSEASVESDYNAAQSYTKNESIKVGRLFTYYMSGSIPKAIPNSKMLWAYQTTTTHRTNGIKTGTTYSIVIYTYGEKNPVTLSMPNEAVTQTVLERFHTTLPWVVVGFSEDIKRLFFKDRPRFLELRYNTVEHYAVDPSAAAYGQNQ